MSLNFHRWNSGIGVPAIVVLIIVVIAVVGVGAYVVVNSKSTPSSSTVPSSVNTFTMYSSSSSTPSSALSSQNSLTSSSVSSTNSNESITSSLNYSAVFANIKDLTGNFSSMGLEYSEVSSNASQNANGSASYFVVGHSTVNGTILTEVNITTIGFDESGTTNTSALVWFNSLGNITQADVGGQTLSGKETILAGFLVYPFVIFFSYQNTFLANQTLFKDFHNTATNAETIGSITMPVTTYQANNVVYGNTTIQSATLKIGQIPGTNLHLTVEIDGQGYSTGGTSGSATFNFKVLTLTRA